MSPFQSIITVICAVIASSGFWSYILNNRNKKNVYKDMLIGLGHDRIFSLGMKYIQRGYIYTIEYENLIDYLYKPYKELGGNGSADKIIEEVKKLEIRREGQDVIK